MGFLATAIIVYFNVCRSSSISGPPELDWPETVFEALSTSTRPPLSLTRADPTLVPLGLFIILVMSKRLGWTSLSPASPPFVTVATCLFVTFADPFTVCVNALLFGMSLGCTLDFLFAFYNKNHIVLRSAFDKLSSALLSYIKPYCSMAAVILLALFSIGVYHQRRKQTIPLKTNNGDVPSERIAESDDDTGKVSDVEVTSMFTAGNSQFLPQMTSPAATLTCPTNSDAISQPTKPEYREAGVEASFPTFLLPTLQAVLIIGPVLSSYTADVAQVFHYEIVDTGSMGEHAEARATQSIARNPLNNLIQKYIMPSCRRCLSGHRQPTELSEHIATNIEQCQDDYLVETSPTPSGSPSFLELTDSPSLITDSEEAHTAAATKTPVVLDHYI
ncbi:hypothetical protein IW262DRAFT_1469211 [Armillaria fumosa]|nr:hypothetical protein IW262DRAFT_1469211 [Armillaria fumosa]